jgi:putative endopeptidase
MRNTVRGAAAIVAAFAFVLARPALAEDAVAPPHYGAWGIDLTARDLSVKPGVDFYRYANGNWLKRAEIPADRPDYDTFSVLGDRAKAEIRKLIEDAAAGRSDDKDAGKIGAAYQAFMDEARIEQLDAKPLTPYLAAVRAEKTKADVVALMGTAPKSAQSSIFGVGISADDKAPDRYAVSLSTAGSGLPDRDYYLKPELAGKKAAYQVYVAKMLGMIDWPAPEINAKAIVDFETKLAEARWPRADLRDPDKLYNPMSPAELAAYAPGFDFRAFLANAGLGDVTRVIVGTNTAFPKYAKIFDVTPLDTLKAWQAFHLASDGSGLLSKRFVDANFDFYGKTISGQSDNEPRWKRAVAFVNGIIPESIGRIYVARYFPPEAKAKIDDLVTQVIAAMHRRIAAVDWMSDATKAKAQQKLSKLRIKIGYPAKWRDYSSLALRADDLVGDAERSQAYEWSFRLARLNKPVDRDEWDQMPQTVNAGYSPNNNDLTFLAAILQPPFFDPKADMAVNYGGIGAVIGHEITHGFDDQGRKYDGNGALKTWWSAEDAAKFKSRADLLAAQFDKFEPIKGTFVNGQLTMGENIADLGGLLLALDAYHAALHDQPAPVLDGLSGDQRLFLAWAQGWQAKRRPDYATVLVKSDPHSPPEFRVDGPLRNIASWYAAFDIKPGDPMYLAPDKRVKIW